MDLLTLTAWLGGSAWVERRTFEAFGTLQRRSADPAVVVAAARHARQHAWHAEVWLDRVPELAHVDPDDVVGPPDPGIAALLERLGAAGDSADDSAGDHAGGPGAPDASDADELAVGLYRVVVPYLTARYAGVVEQLNEVSEAPVLRWLGFVRADLATEADDGRDLLAVVADDQRSRAVRTELEGLLTSS